MAAKKYTVRPARGPHETIREYVPGVAATAAGTAAVIRFAVAVCSTADCPPRVMAGALQKLEPLMEISASVASGTAETMLSACALARRGKRRPTARTAAKRVRRLRAIRFLSLRGDYVLRQVRVCRERE